MRRSGNVWVAIGAVLLVLALSLWGCAAPAGAPDVVESAAFVERVTPVLRGGDEGNETVPVRFFDAVPGIAYIACTDFQSLVHPGTSLTVIRGEDGTYTLVSPDGVATIDVERDTLSSPDFYAFTRTTGPSGAAVEGLLLDGMPCCRYGVTMAPQGAGAVTFDFARYGIDLIESAGQVYLPLATLSDLYDDTTLNHRVAYNGRKICVVSQLDTGGVIDVDPSFYEGMNGGGERDAALADFGYRELCFSLDAFYGHPGRALIDEGLATEGLDESLEERAGAGGSLASLLRSPDVADYLSGLLMLNWLLQDGGHSALFSESYMNYNDGLVGDSDELIARGSKAVKESDLEAIHAAEREFLVELEDLSGREEQRDLALGADVTYYTYDDTAVFVLRGFDAEVERWVDYYADEGRDLSSFLAKARDEGADEDDDLIAFLLALQRAADDPKIRHFVIDLSCNSGGNEGVMLTIASLVCGASEMHLQDVLTGTDYIQGFAVDRNFDGVFDERDEEVSFDFDFSVLTSSSSFSCATMLAALMRDAGCLVLGERSGGGSCSVQHMYLVDGNGYQISSSRMRHTDACGDNLDEGVPVDVDLMSYEPDGSLRTVQVMSLGLADDADEDDMRPTPDYGRFFDGKELARILQEHGSDASRGA